MYLSASCSVMIYDYELTVYYDMVDSLGKG